jgi:hypothetical protein
VSWRPPFVCGGSYRPSISASLAVKRVISGCFLVKRFNAGHNVHSLIQGTYSHTAILPRILTPWFAEFSDFVQVEYS